MKWRWMLFGVLALAQLAVPAWMIAGQERVLARGEVYRFRLRPADPYDPFRGRYLQLAFADNMAPAPGVARERLYGQKLCAKIVVDAEGFAKVESLSVKPPAEGPYVWVRTLGDWGDGKVRFDLPFDRYYLREDLAPKAEALLRERLRPPEPLSRPSDGPMTGEEMEALKAWHERPAEGVYATVRILNGRAALEELYVDGEPILKYLATHEVADE